MKACLDCGDVNEVVDKFFNDKYGKASDKVLSIMEKLRNTVDTMETITAKEYWPIPNYSELLFGVK